MPLLRNIWFELAYIPRSSRGRVGLEEGGEDRAGIYRNDGWDEIR